MASRMMLCPPCAKRLEREAAKYIDEGEATRFVHGTSRQSCVCDLCNAALDVGSPCAASTTVGPGQTDCVGWEPEYVEVTP